MTKKKRGAGIKYKFPYGSIKKGKVTTYKPKPGEDPVKVAQCVRAKCIKLEKPVTISVLFGNVYVKGL